MSEGGGIDIGLQNFQRGIGGGGPKNSKADKTNEESQADAAVEAAGHQIAGLAEHLHIDLGELGSAGLQRALGGDTEGIAGKTIMPSVLPDAQGGFIAKLLHAVFVKNRDITDHTQGVGGGEGISAASGGEGFHGADFAAMAGSSSNYPDYPMLDMGSGFSATGNLPSQNFDVPISAPSRGGAELG